MNKIKVAIYTLTWNRLKYTKKMLKALRENTLTPYDHFIIDNGSTDGTIEFLKKSQAKFKKIIFNKENKGLIIGQRQALDEIGKKYDYIIKLDNDIEIKTKCWLKTFIKISKKMNDKIILSPYMDYGTIIKEKIKYGIITDNRFKDYVNNTLKGYDYIHIANYRVGLVNQIGGMTRFAHKKMYNLRWNENVPLYYDEDRLFNERANKKGYLRGVVQEVIATNYKLQEFRDKNYAKERSKAPFLIPNKKYNAFQKILIHLKGINYRYYRNYGRMGNFFRKAHSIWRKIKPRLSN